MRTYTIKPLEWVLNQTTHRAETPYGTLACFVIADNKQYVSLLLRNGIYHRTLADSSDTIESAKLAAERWYIEQIEQALLPQGE